MLHNEITGELDMRHQLNTGKIRFVFKNGCEVHGKSIKECIKLASEMVHCSHFNTTPLIGEECKGVANYDPVTFTITAKLEDTNV